MLKSNQSILIKHTLFIKYNIFSQLQNYQNSFLMHDFKYVTIKINSILRINYCLLMKLPACSGCRKFLFRAKIRSLVIKNFYFNACSTHGSIASRSYFPPHLAFGGYERCFTFTSRVPEVNTPAMLRNTSRNVMKPWRAVVLNTMM